MKVTYYGTDPDVMWAIEVESLMPWFFGKGVDIGCGTRSIKKNILRVDLDPKVKPDLLASGDKLPLKDNEFDFVCSIHSFEHFADSGKLIKEWLRIVKPGGIIGIVHPDILHTKKQNPEIDNKGLRENPFNRHYCEHTIDSFITMLAEWPDLPFKVVDYGPACAKWSFYVIIKKTGS